MTMRKLKTVKSLSLILLLSFLFTIFLPGKALYAATLSVSGEAITLAPGQNYTFDVSWNSDAAMSGVEVEASVDAPGFEVTIVPYGKNDQLSSGDKFAEVFEDGPTSGKALQITLTAPAEGGTASINISAIGRTSSKEPLSASNSYAVTVQAAEAPATEPTEPTDPTTAPTETTTEPTAPTTAEPTTTTPEATTTTVAPETTPETTAAPETTPETAATQASYALKANGTQNKFVLVTANDVTPPVGFERTEGNFEGSKTALFTRAGSLPLVYGALASETAPFFYIYDASAKSLYNFYDDILIPSGGKTWAISPIAVAAPSVDFQYRSISINNQPMSAYESQLGGKKTTLLFAAENGQTNKSLYIYNPANTTTPLLPYHPNAITTPTPTSAAALISLSATTPSEKQEEGGLDFLTILLIIIFIALAGGLAYVGYLNRAKIMALFNHGKGDDDLYYDDDDYYEDDEEDYFDDDHDDDHFNQPPPPMPPIRRV